MIAQAFLVIIAASGGGVLAAPAIQSNWYMDQVLNHLRAIAMPSNVDPARIMDIIPKTEHRFPSAAPNTRFHYVYGKMTGLLRIQRTGDCSAPIREYQNSTITCMLLVNDIKFEYNADLKYGSYSYVKGIVTAAMGPTYVDVEITSNIYRNSPILRKLHITRTGAVVPNFPRNWPTNYYPTEQEQREFATALTAEFNSVFNFNFDPSLRIAVSRVVLPVP